MNAFVYSGLNSLIKESDRKRFLSLESVQECFANAEKILKENFDVHIDFNELAQMPAEKIYSLDRINLVTTLVVCLQVGVTRALQQKGIVPDYLSAISLGDVARTVISGAVTFEDAVQISNVNEDEKRNLDRFGETAALFARIDSPVEIEDIQYFASMGIGTSQLSPRLFNLSGSFDSMNKVRELAQTKQWRVIHLLNYPFHSEVLEPYSSLMQNFLQKLKISDPQIPIFSTTLSKVLTRRQELLEEQILTITHPHHWMTSVTAMHNLGVREFINIGPCKTLSKAIAEIDSSIKVQEAIDLLH